MTTTKYLDIVLETMTNKISNSNKSNIHIHIGDKGKKRRRNRRKTASRGHGSGTYVTNNNHISVPLFNRPQTLDTSLGDERERERIRIQRGIFESQIPSNNVSSSFANGVPQNGQPAQAEPKAEPPPAQPKTEQPPAPAPAPAPIPIPAPAPAIRASKSQHVLKHKEPHSAPEIEQNRAELEARRSAEEEALRRAARAQALRELELRAIEAEQRRQYREEQNQARARYNTGVEAIINSDPVPQPVAMDVPEADLPVDDIPPPAPPRHVSSRPGPFSSRIGPFTSQNPSSGSASGVMQSDPVPSNQPPPVPVHHPIPVIRYDPNGPYASISRRRSHLHRGRDGPFSSNPHPIGKFYKRHDGEDIPEARDFKKTWKKR